ncbi:cytochrome C [Rhodobacter sp. TJ_12]|uniref:c-type cytochrome n=1 Tax=Rhodobacter sp. TJ_12 TaxID=2029399 RepID=UPI001CBCAD7C|nr:cytochrome c [Rhodobacter sp. TJ_12]MBZ4024009.1 cytochrome C [Rhodobacter sp. TJ_12]
MKHTLLFAGGGTALALAAALLLQSSFLSAQANPRPLSELALGDPIVEVQLPETLSPQAQMGQRAFNAVCAACHGPSGSGRAGMGPPLVHRIYEPNHHADAAFFLAVAQGVRAHHWPFGNMPPQAGLTRADVGNIVTYVRELQRANGIE